MALREETTGAWTALVRTHRILMERVEADMKAADVVPLTWYDALLEIERAGPSGLRPFELKDRLLLAQYNTSRLLDRLEKAGLIRREKCGEDGRGQILRVTKEGAIKRREAWRVYERFLKASVQAALTPEELGRLAKMLKRLAAGPG